VPPTFEAQRPNSSHGEKAICQRRDSFMHAILTERRLKSYTER